MNENGQDSYTFELKDLNYNDLYSVYNSMNDFIIFLTKARDSVELVKEEKEESEKKEES